MRLELRPTLETDAACEVWLTAKPNVELGDGRPISGNVVDAEFARRLERERDYMKRHCNRITADFNAVAEESCQLQDALGFPCETENAQEKAMERIRDLIAAEGELGDAKEQIDKLEAEGARLHTHWHNAEAKRQSLFRAWQRVMERMENRSLYYGHTSDQAKGGRKQYTKSQLEAAKSKVMQEARLIVWMFLDVDDALASESQREAAGTADEKPDGQAENVDVDARGK